MLEVAIESFDRQLRIRLHRGLEARQIVLRNSEVNRDRLQLRNHRESGRVGRMNDIARIHQPEPDPPGDRRSDAAVSELKFGIVDDALVALDRASELSDQSLLVVEVLSRDN